jgi:hypothetical protein
MLGIDVGRTKEFEKNEKLEAVLMELNGLLSKIQQKVNRGYERPKYPVLLVVGCPRSGTTLLMQWLASLGLFAYPTNLSSRFYCTPYVGARVQQALVDYDYRQEVFGGANALSFESQLGKTKGPLEPNEFWYFWRRFFDFDEIQVLQEEQLKQTDTKRFLSEIGSFEAVFNKPVAMKALILNWHLPFLNSLFDKVLFLYIKRNPVYNAQSILLSRKKFFNSYERWYSFKPPQYAELIKKEPFYQVAGQVYYTNKAVEEGLRDISRERVLEVEYHQFCHTPRRLFDQVVEHFAQMDFKPDWKYEGVNKFNITDKTRIPHNEFNRIVRAYEDISGETVEV